MGIVPKDKVDATDPWASAYHVYGGLTFYRPREGSHGGTGDPTHLSLENRFWGRGDEITLKVYLDDDDGANSKIAFMRNGADVGAPQNIRRGTYYFACSLFGNGNGLTIVERN